MSDYFSDEEDYDHFYYEEQDGSALMSDENLLDPSYLNVSLQKLPTVLSALENNGVPISDLPLDLQELVRWALTIQDPSLCGIEYIRPHEFKSENDNTRKLKSNVENVISLLQNQLDLAGERNRAPLSGRAEEAVPTLPGSVEEGGVASTQVVADVLDLSEEEVGNDLLEIEEERDDFSPVVVVEDLTFDLIPPSPFEPTPPNSPHHNTSFDPYFPPVFDQTPPNSPPDSDTDSPPYSDSNSPPDMHYIHLAILQLPR